LSSENRLPKTQAAHHAAAEKLAARLDRARLISLGGGWIGINWTARNGRQQYRRCKGWFRMRRFLEYLLETPINP